MSDRCGICLALLQRATTGVNRGKVVFTYYTDENNIERKAHKICAERRYPKITADIDHYAEVTGTAKKPPHE